VVLVLSLYVIPLALKFDTPIGLSANMEIAPGNLLIILVNETKILLLKEPNNDLSAYFLFPLNLTSSVLFFLGVGDVVCMPSTSFKVSKVKN
jgi:hypothetical protein